MSEVSPVASLALLTPQVKQRMCKLMHGNKELSLCSCCCFVSVNDSARELPLRSVGRKWAQSAALAFCTRRCQLAKKQTAPRRIHKGQYAFGLMKHCEVKASEKQHRCFFSSNQETKIASVTVVTTKKHIKAFAKTTVEISYKMTEKTGS